MNFKTRIIIAILLIFLALVAGKYNEINNYIQNKQQTSIKAQILAEQQRLQEIKLEEAKVEKKEISISEDCWDKK